VAEEEEMSDGELKRRVSVRGKPHEIGLYRKSKNVWIALGDYMGTMITVQDRSEGATIERWREAAGFVPQHLISQRDNNFAAR